jgi:hypothetical protein
MDEPSRGELYRALQEPNGEQKTDASMSLIPEGDAPPSREELRQLEARVDARFQAVSARFTTVDRRFAGMGERVEGLELNTRVLTEQFHAHCKTMDGRFDAVDARIDLVHDNLAIKLDRSDRRQGRNVLVGIAGSTFSTAMLCMGTLLVVI